MEEGKNISIAVIAAQTDITPKLQEDKVIFDIIVEARGAVQEDLSNEDLYKSDILHKVETKFAEQIKNPLLATIKQMTKGRHGFCSTRSHSLANAS